MHQFKVESFVLTKQPTMYVIHTFIQYSSTYSKMKQGAVDTAEMLQSETRTCQITQSVNYVILTIV